MTALRSIDRLFDQTGTDSSAKRSPMPLRLTLKEINMTPNDRSWFDAHLGHAYRCRHQTDAEKGADRGALSSPAYGLCIIRERDGSMVEIWTANPDLYTSGDDDELGSWFDHYREQAI